jgi:hypothetical protein
MVSECDPKLVDFYVRMLANGMDGDSFAVLAGILDSLEHACQMYLSYKSSLVGAT